MPRVSEQLAELNRDLDIAKYYRKRFLPDWNYWELVYNDLIWGGQEKPKGSRRSSVNDKGYIPQLNELESVVLNIIPISALMGKKITVIQ